MDFISILAVGTIGFTSVYFSLLHSRQLDEQRRQLIALNTRIAEAVNREVESSTVLQSALAHVTDILPTLEEIAGMPAAQLPAREAGLRFQGEPRRSPACFLAPAIMSHPYTRLKS